MLEARGTWSLCRSFTIPRKEGSLQIHLETPLESLEEANYPRSACLLLLVAMSEFPIKIDERTKVDAHTINASVVRF